MKYVNKKKIIGTQSKFHAIEKAVRILVLTERSTSMSCHLDRESKNWQKDNTQCKNQCSFQNRSLYCLI